MCAAARNWEETLMFDYLWTGLVAVFLLVYLLVALLKPERF
jgi:K+-transporting ATPase KdpF subunit